LMLEELLREIHDASLRLAAGEGEDVLRVSPASNLTPELSATITEHKAALIRVALEDQRFHETGIIQAERQVFELAREHFDLDKPEGIAHQDCPARP
jgi:hypothetical protein